MIVARVRSFKRANVSNWLVTVSLIRIMHKLKNCLSVTCVIRGQDGRSPLFDVGFTSPPRKTRAEGPIHLHIFFVDIRYFDYVQSLRLKTNDRTSHW